MSWGAMMGLGQGLQGVGNMIMDYNKDKLRERLEIEREERKAAREEVKEERRLDQWSGKTENRLGEDGVWREIRISNRGVPMNQARELTEQEIAAIERSARKDDLSLQSLEEGLRGTQLSNQKTELELSTWAEDREMAIEEHNARISQMRARALRASSSGSGVSEEVEVGASEIASTLTSEFKDLISSYTGGDRPKLTREEVENIAYSVAIVSVRQGRDAAQMFRQELAKAAAGDSSNLEPIFR